MCRHAAAEPPKVNPLSFVPESLTQPGRESDRDVSMWTFSERRLRGMTLRCLVIVLALLAAFASDSWAQSKPPPTQAKQSAQPSTADQRGDRILMWGLRHPVTNSQATSVTP